MQSVYVYYECQEEEPPESGPSGRIYFHEEDEELAGDLVAALQLRFGQRPIVSVFVARKGLRQLHRFAFAHESEFTVAERIVIEADIRSSKQPEASYVLWPRREYALRAEEYAHLLREKRLASTEDGAHGPRPGDLAEAPGGEQARPDSRRDEGSAQLHGVRPAAKAAAESFEWVCTARPDLIPAPPGKYSREQWSYIKENGCPAYAGVQVPDFETWKRQIRAGTADPDSPGASSRAGRDHGRSIVKSDDL